MSENTAPVTLLTNKLAAFFQYNEVIKWMLARYVHSTHFIQDRHREGPHYGPKKIKSL